MASPFLLLLLFLLPSAIASLSFHDNSLSSHDNSSAHDQLAQNGFPIGLLPDTILSYDLHSTGQFKVLLERDCHFLIPDDQYPVSYSSVISGTLSYGSIKDLHGISVKAYYKWWTITGIHVNQNDLVFEIGPINVNYPMSNFEDSPICDGWKAKISRSSS